MSPFNHGKPIAAIMFILTQCVGRVVGFGAGYMPPGRGILPGLPGSRGSACDTYSLTTWGYFCWERDSTECTRRSTRGDCPTFETWRCSQVGCWDANGNDSCDRDLEDINRDSHCDVLDCIATSQRNQADREHDVITHYQKAQPNAPPLTRDQVIELVCENFLLDHYVTGFPGPSGH